MSGRIEDQQTKNAGLWGEVEWMILWVWVGSYLASLPSPAATRSNLLLATSPQEESCDRRLSTIYLTSRLLNRRQEREHFLFAAFKLMVQIAKIFLNSLNIPNCLNSPNSPSTPNSPNSPNSSNSPNSPNCANIPLVEWSRYTWGPEHQKGNWLPVSKALGHLGASSS